MPKYNDFDLDLQKTLIGDFNTQNDSTQDYWASIALQLVSNCDGVCSSSAGLSARGGGNEAQGCCAD